MTSLYNLAANIPATIAKYFSILTGRRRLAYELKALANPLDAGFFRIDFNNFKFHESGNVNTFSDQLNNLFERGEFDKLVLFIFASLPVKFSQHVSADYFYPFASYYMACFYAAQRNFEKAAHYAKLIEFDAPPDGTDFLPYDIRIATRLVKYRQEQAMKQNSPSIVIFSLMKSASAYTADLLSQLLDAPIVRLSVGEGINACPVPGWVRQIVRGGAVTHEHLEAHPDHLAVLQSAGLENIWVQIRDPRDAAYSVIMSGYPAGMSHPLDSPESIPALFVRCCELYAQWIDGWILASQSQRYSLDIQFITYDEATSDFPRLARRVLNGSATPVLLERLKQMSEEIPFKSRRNFRKGTGGEWRKTVDMTVQKQIWEVLPDNVKSFLHLEC